MFDCFLSQSIVLLNSCRLADAEQMACTCGSPQLHVCADSKCVSDTEVEGEGKTETRRNEEALKEGRP